MISVVIPVYNQRSNLKELYSQISYALGQTDERWELLLVDDGSKDDSASEIRELASKDSRVKGLKLSRNFGQYAATEAGIDNAGGDAVIIMDDDLQEPPSLIPRLIKEWKSGYKAVYTITTKRQDSFSRRFFAWLFYKLFGKASYLGNIRNISEMRLIDKEVANLFRQLKEKPRFLKGTFFWFGFRHTFIEYEKQERRAGKSGYSFRKLAKLAFDGISSFSLLPIKAVTYTGVFVLGIGILYLIFVLIFSSHGQSSLPSVAPVIFVVLFVGGVQLISFGILGEYIGRIYEEVRNRPNYIIEERINLKPKFSGHN